MWIASIQVVISLLAIPMCKSPMSDIKITLTNDNQDVFGKRNRNFFHKHDLLKLIGLA